MSADVLIYLKWIYDHLQSTAPAGVTEEAFRLPPNATRAQRQAQDFAQGDASGKLPAAAGQDFVNRTDDGRSVAAPAGLQAGSDAKDAPIPIKPTEALLRPFYNCPPDELELAWAAMHMVAKVDRERAIQNTKTGEQT